MDVAQYMFHQPIINPASATSYEEVNAALLSRQQWIGFEGAPKLNVLNVNMPFLKTSAGVSVLHEKLGVHTNTRFWASYAYRTRLSTDKYLSFGLSAGALFMKDDLNAVTSIEGNDTEFLLDQNITRADFQLGLYYFSRKYYLGLTIPSLLNNQIYYDPVERKQRPDYNPKYYHYYLQAGYELALHKDWDLNVSSLVKYLVDTSFDADFNAQLRYQKRYGAGFSYRTTKEALAFVNLRLTPMFKLGYAYQYTFGLGHEKLSSHEVMLIFSMDKPATAIIQSPRF
jgi:type IX secretion system PorP/SprF family membrane protein